MKKPDLPAVPDTLESLLQRVKDAYQPLPIPPKRGKKPDFSELSWLLLAVIAVTLRTFKDSELHRLLTKDEALCLSLGFCRVPHRTWIGRRLNGLVSAAETQIAAYRAAWRTPLRISNPGNDGSIKSTISKS